MRREESGRLEAWRLAAEVGEGWARPSKRDAGSVLGKQTGEREVASPVGAGKQDTFIYFSAK